ncbi:ABC transporter substrate-binding protein [Allosphingosinicella flava]|uniref:ABC transporter substrate-binding protein n=1 Tax=Allosphingosinicella flava TaxID=2771430 RepID=A0A7T2GJ49_9SPHN|nr:ABC transporter substrate-binding protein [Sphingosinicella flava]QPQ54841.1 ABC transporter substrate-binding protein [Sphingosinicella flava]
MARPRIVSLLPSATEIAVALGFGGNLVGRSHECDFPAFVQDLPVCTATKLEKRLRSIEIDRRVQSIVEQGLSLYEVDADLLKALKPDVILTQTQCAVCAVTPDDLQAALDSWVGTKPILVSTAPDDLADVWQDFRNVAVALGTDGEEVIDGLKARLASIAPTPSCLRVAAIEWIEPLMAAGNWIPELIGIAGGESLFAAPGQHSPWLAWDDLAAADPDAIILMPCGFQISQTLGDMGPLLSHPFWPKLKAVRDRRIYVADGHHFYNRPGPRLVESTEMLAAMLAGEDKQGQGWVRLV